MSMALTANLSKPGTLRFLTRRVGEPPPAGAQAVLDAVAANNLAAANFTGSMGVGNSAAAATAQLCIADGADFLVYAVAQDREGENAGRWPNNSTVSSTTVKLVEPAGTASCEPAQFLAPLQPTVRFEAGSPGLSVGPVNATVDADTGTTTWTQDTTVFIRQQPMLVAQTMAWAGSVMLGPGASFNIIL